MKKFTNSTTYLALAAAHTGTLFGAGDHAVTIATAILCGLMAIQEAKGSDKK